MFLGCTLRLSLLQDTGLRVGGLGTVLHACLAPAPVWEACQVVVVGMPSVEGIGAWLQGLASRSLGFRSRDSLVHHSMLLPHAGRVRLVSCVDCRHSVCAHGLGARVAETGACHVARGCCWRFVSEGGGWCVRIDGVCCGSTQHRHTTTRPQQHRHTDAAPPHDPCCGQSQSTSRSRVGVGVRFQVMCSVSPFQTPRASPPAWFGVGMQC